MKPTASPHPKRWEYLILVGRLITHGGGLLAAQLLFTDNSSFPAGCCPTYIIYLLACSCLLSLSFSVCLHTSCVPDLPIHRLWFEFLLFHYSLCIKCALCSVYWEEYRHKNPLIRVKNLLIFLSENKRLLTMIWIYPYIHRRNFDSNKKIFEMSHKNIIIYFIDSENRW